MSKKPASKKPTGKRPTPKITPKAIPKRAQKLTSEQEHFFGTEDVAGTAVAMDAPLEEVATALPEPQSGSDTDQNDSLLTRARAAWEMGDWAVLAGLADLDAHPLDTHPERGKLALLAAVGLAQLGDMARARDFGQKAQNWGCPARLMAQVLIGGVLNSLGRAACLLQDDTRARRYFESSIACVNPKADAAILARARDINEKLALGLLPDAAAALGQSLDQMTGDQSIPSGQAEIFRIQMDFLRGSLALAQQRHQLTPGAGLKAPVTRRHQSRAAVPAPFIIAAAGVPRSGSTWVYNAARLLCEKADLSCYATWCEEYEPEAHADCDIHLVKLHKVEDLTFTSHQILTTHRDLVDRLASLLHMGWLKDDPQKIRRAAENETRLDSRWAALTSCETQYEDIVHRPRQAVLEIAQALEITCSDATADAIAVQLDQLTVPKSTDNEHKHDPLTLLHPNHRATKSQRKKSQSIIRAALAGAAE